MFSAASGHSGTHTVTWTTQGNSALTVPAGTLTLSGTNYVETFSAEKTFTASSTQAGLRLGSLAGDPSSGLANGSLWYNSTLHAPRTRINGTTRSLLHSGSSLAELGTRNAADLTGTLGAAQLPLPGTTTLGGVMRNAGTAGQYVTGINSSGQLTFGTPVSGSSITTPGIAYIQTNGNNTTGVIGDPSKPFLTAQAAFDQGAEIFHLGSGITTGVSVVGTSDVDVTLYLFVTGSGLTASSFSVSAEAEDGTVDVRVRSNFTVQFSSVVGNSTNGASCYVEVYAAVVSAFDSQCPAGTATAKAAFCEIGSDLSGLLPTSSFMSNVGGISYP